MGRPRKAVADLKLHGNFREDRHAGREDFEEEFGGVPEPPCELSADEKWLWDLVLEEYGDRGPICRLDSATLYLTCVEFGLLMSAQRERDSDRVEKHMNSYRQLSASLGLNPRDRRSIAPSGGKKPTGVKRRKRA